MHTEIEIHLYTFQPGVIVKHSKEGTESSAFWFALGGKQNYASKKVTPEVFRDAHLFAFSFNKGRTLLTMCFSSTWISFQYSNMKTVC